MKQIKRKKITKLASYKQTNKSTKLKQQNNQDRNKRKTKNK